MTTQTPAPTGICHVCRRPIEPGYHLHRECLAEYRASEPYRDKALLRDGYNCAVCWDWRNRLALWTRSVLNLSGPPRRVEVDHIVPLALGGTHDYSNLQVLCLRHHAAKTRQDVAHMRGLRRAPLTRHQRWAAEWGALIGLLLVVWVYYRVASLPATSLPNVLRVLGLILWGTAVSIAIQGTKQRTRVRLHSSLSKKTGCPNTPQAARKYTKTRRWRVCRVEGLRTPRLRPTQVTIKYPETAPDDQPDWQTSVESALQAKLGVPGWAAHWYTGADKMVMTHPDPLSLVGGTPWPFLTGTGAISLWDPIPIGIAENGETVNLLLPEHNVLIGGEPGSGKSGILAMLKGAAVLDPTVTNWDIDGKHGMELGIYKRIAREGDTRGATAGGFVGDETPTDDDPHIMLKNANRLLAALQLIINQRGHLMAEEGLLAVTRDAGYGLHVLTVDELALFTQSGQRTLQDEFTTRLRDVISRGRALGIISLLATQRPSADVVPTAVRDIVGVRLALRCTTPTSSDMILGAGWASRGFGSHRFGMGDRGMAAGLVGEGSVPVRLRGFWVGGEARRGVVARAEALRGLVVPEGLGGLRAGGLGSGPAGPEA